MRPWWGLTGRLREERRVGRGGVKGGHREHVREE